ncbi:hypothetical protein [uncultured Bosea sp.]|uniref:hypothetical protein n=1 Tax=uncultured Bosea sp. TaxID=211457 RepID=UPI0025EF2E30|nr:hypothetical protein [uncultured Bosea sp.]
MTDDEFSKRIKKADEDVRAYANGRSTTFRSHAHAVRIFYPQILKMRQVDASWEVIAPQLKQWSGRDVAPATIKQYVTDINVGRMSRELSSTARPQAQTPSAPPAGASHSIQDSREDQPREERSGTTTSVPDSADDQPMPGGFDPGADFQKKRKT